MTTADHPHTDPGDGRTECQPCGKWVWPAIHSCKGVPVTAAALARMAARPRAVMTPYVGPPDTAEDGTCCYALDLDQPKCVEAATVHILTDSPWGVVALRSCNGHEATARTAGRPLAEHPYGPACAADCWEAPPQCGVCGGWLGPDGCERGHRDA